jgi:hypothetical protein
MVNLPNYDEIEDCIDCINELGSGSFRKVYACDNKFVVKKAYDEDFDEYGEAEEHLDLAIKANKEEFKTFKFWEKHGYSKYLAKSYQLFCDGELLLSQKVSRIDWKFRERTSKIDDIYNKYIRHNEFPDIFSQEDLDNCILAIIAGPDIQDDNFGVFKENMVIIDYQGNSLGRWYSVMSNTKKLKLIKQAEKIYKKLLTT